jgi:hypothetical protein
LDRFGASADVKGNLQKARIILNKSLSSIAAARALTSRTDKTFLCDKDYSQEAPTSDTADVSTKSATSPKKYEKLKGLKERRFRYKKDMESDSVTSLIADLHVELIFLYYKVSLRMLDFTEAPVGALKQNPVEKEFEALLGECRNSKICQALLLMGKVLYLNAAAVGGGKDSDKVKQEQKALTDVRYSFFFNFIIN